MNTNVSTGTIARTAALAVTLLNMILTAAGKNPLPFSDTDVYLAVTTVAAIVASVIAWWKNNSFTKAARYGDVAMNTYREAEKNGG